MTTKEYNEAAALVVRLREDLVLHADSLQRSNAQCGEYLRQNERLAADAAALHRDLVNVRAALASVTEQRDSLQRTLDEWSNADTQPHERVAADDVADHVVPPVLPLCNVCHGCGSVLYPGPAGDYLCCGNVRCTRSNTKHWRPGCTIGPYAGPCKSTTPVRHE